MADIQRLRHLMGIIEKTSESTFDMSDWVVRNECGTVCCALGWAAQDPEFIKQGLTLTNSRPGYDTKPVYGDCSGYAAAQEFFDISVRDSYQLFSGPTIEELKESGMSEKEYFLTSLDIFIEGAM